MTEKLYIYTEIDFKNFIKGVFFDYEIIEISFEDLKKTTLKNKKILIITKECLYRSFNPALFLNNNIIIFSSKREKNINQLVLENVNYLHGPTTLIKFLDYVRGNLIFNSSSFKDIKIIGEKIINLNNNLDCSITILEKKILLELFDKIKIDRDYFLEKILEIKKDIETKTIESHLTRIRKKLLSIKSKVQIFSKEDIFFLDF